MSRLVRGSVARGGGGRVLGEVIVCVKKKLLVGISSLFEILSGVFYLGFSSIVGVWVMGGHLHGANFFFF
jgi:hypothetical protein